MKRERNDLLPPQDSPQLWLRLGQNLKQDQIKVGFLNFWNIVWIYSITLYYIWFWLQEGDDVYFDCEIQANPRVHEIVWKHNVRKISILKATVNTYIQMFWIKLHIQNLERNDKKSENITRIVIIISSFEWVYHDILWAGRSPGSKQRRTDHERGKFDHPTSFKRL